ncbi:toll/interleukin-1 receptor domain-containing protein [Micromonospora chalcea]
MQVFISYAYEDLSTARSLAEALRSVGVSVTSDRDIAPGERIGSVLSSRIKSAQAVVVLVTKASAESSWVEEEVMYAIAGTFVETSKRVIPVVVGNVPLPPFLAPFRGLYIEGPETMLDAARMIKDSLSELPTHRNLPDELAQIQAERRYLKSVNSAVAAATAANYERSIVAMTAVSVILGLVSGVVSLYAITRSPYAFLGLLLGIPIIIFLHRRGALAQMPKGGRGDD